MLELPAIHHPAAVQRRLPVSQCQAAQQLRGQQHINTVFTFGWQRQGKIRFVQGHAQVQAHMPVTQLMTDQCRRQQHPRIGARLTLQQKPGQRPVQCAQPTAGQPVIQQRQQCLGILQGVRLLLALFQPIDLGVFHRALSTAGWPINSRSRSSIRRCGGRSCQRPVWGESTPRTNQYSAPPMCVS